MKTLAQIGCTGLFVGFVLLWFKWRPVNTLTCSYPGSLQVRESVYGEHRYPQIPVSLPVSSVTSCHHHYSDNNKINVNIYTVMMHSFWIGRSGQTV